MRVRIGRWVLAAMFLSAAGSANAAVFFNDLSAANGGSESASGVNWLTSTFTTDSSAYTQLANPDGSRLMLRMSDDGFRVIASFNIVVV